ncbi:MAG: PsiF family protein [Burkholderiaceae bacterium]|nr:PsiF family protein [Burkholderiaceae bacterium]
MKLLISAIALALAALAGPSFAASHAGAAPMADKKPTAQQGKMANCNKDAGEKKGDERKAFMKECLSAKADGRAAQQEKMKMCNKDASDKKGDARKAFMKECLSKKA